MYLNLELLERNFSCRSMNAFVGKGSLKMIDLSFVNLESRAGSEMIGGGRNAFQEQGGRVQIASVNERMDDVLYILNQMH